MRLYDLIADVFARIRVYGQFQAVGIRFRAHDGGERSAADKDLHRKIVADDLDLHAFFAFAGHAAHARQRIGVPFGAADGFARPRAVKHPFLPAQRKRNKAFSFFVQKQAERTHVFRVQPHRPRFQTIGQKRDVLPAQYLPARIDGRLPQFAVLHLDAARHGELPRPAVPFGRVGAVPHVQPADQNGGARKGLRRIKIESVVDGFSLSAAKTARKVERSDPRETGMDVAVRGARRGLKLFGIEQQPEVVAVIGAFRHRTFAVAAEHVQHKFPAEQVVRTEQEDPAPAVPLSGGGHAVEGAVFAEHLGVAEIPRAVFGRKFLFADHHAVFDKVHAVLARCEALTLADILAAPVFAKARIEEPEFSLPLDGAARKTAVLRFVGIQCDREALPVRQVAALDVPPVHGAPLRRVRVILKKHMVLTAEQHEAVRVVDPARFAVDMKYRLSLHVRHMLPPLRLLPLQCD